MPQRVDVTQCAAAMDAAPDWVSFRAFSFGSKRKWTTPANNSTKGNNQTEPYTEPYKTKSLSTEKSPPVPFKLRQYFRVSHLFHIPQVWYSIM